MVLQQDSESGSPNPLEFRSPPWSGREVCAEAPAAPVGGGTPPLPRVAVTAVEPSERFGGLLDEQSGTVSLGFHHYGQTAYSFKSLLHVELQLCGTRSSALLRQEWTSTIQFFLISRFL